MNRLLFACLFLSIATIGFPSSRAEADRVVYPGGDGPGNGKQIVFISGDEEYRSEEGLPMLAQILSVRHGFKCTVLFATNPKTGEIDPNESHHIPGMEALKEADMLVLQTRFRELPDSDMKIFVDYVNSGKPILGIRTATHAFQYKDKSSPYAQYDWRSKTWPGGFGRQVLGETWVNHYGSHGHQSTRGIINPEFNDHPVLRGVVDLWGPTDVYEAHPPQDAKVLVFGQVLQGMKPTDPPVQGRKNHPLMPVIWVRTYTGSAGKPARIICSTMGAAVDLENEDLRRLFVNACYWGMGMEDQMPSHANVDFVAPFHPNFFGFNGFKRGLKPSDFDLKK